MERGPGRPSENLEKNAKRQRSIGPHSTDAAHPSAQEGGQGQSLSTFPAKRSDAQQTPAAGNSSGTTATARPMQGRATPGSSLPQSGAQLSLPDPTTLLHPPFHSNDPGMGSMHNRPAHTAEALHAQLLAAPSPHMQHGFQHQAAGEAFIPQLQRMRSGQLALYLPEVPENEAIPRLPLRCLVQADVAAALPPGLRAGLQPPGSLAAATAGGLDRPRWVQDPEAADLPGILTDEERRIGPPTHTLGNLPQARRLQGGMRGGLGTASALCVMDAYATSVHGHGQALALAPGQWAEQRVVGPSGRRAAASGSNGSDEDSSSGSVNPTGSNTMDTIVTSFTQQMTRAPSQAVAAAPAATAAVQAALDLQQPAMALQQQQQQQQRLQGHEDDVQSGSESGDGSSQYTTGAGASPPV